MLKSAATIVAFAAIAETARIKNPGLIAKRLNEYREICNMSAGPNDGINKRRKQMTTNLQFKNFML